MPYVPFHEKFLELAESETRAIILYDDPNIPDGKYYFLESYCDEPDCDCRRVFFSVISETNQILAVIAYGWENKKYYAQWMGENDPKIIRELKGPALNLASSQSKLAPAFLEKVKLILQDKHYLERLKRHYKLFRDLVEKKTVKIENQRNELKEISTASKINPDVGRNALCPCGSGKKYKKCCLMK